jgi:colanic acid/amylovoran biosynthesis glycosyltransferase
MRIAFIVLEFPTVSETAVLNQVIGLLRRGHQVDIYAFTKGTAGHAEVTEHKLLDRTYYFPVAPINKIQRFKKAMGLVTYYFPHHAQILLKSLNFFKYGKSSVALRHLYSASVFLDKAPYDIIHCHYGTLGKTGLFLKDSVTAAGKVVVAFHGYDISSYVQLHGEKIYCELFKHGDLFLPVSNFWGGKLVELGCDQQKIRVHRAGIDLNRFAYVPRNPKSNEKIKLLTVGRLVEKKGLEYGIQAVARVVKEYPNLEYEIVGDGPLRSGLASLIEKLEMHNYVKLLGWKDQQEVATLMYNSDIFMAPSVTSYAGNQEGIPATLMEAMARGLPVLSTYHTGIPELVKDGQSGFLVPERDVTALTEKLTWLASHPQCWSEMGCIGRKLVETYHDINKLNDQLIEIYGNLLQQPK